MSFVVAYCPIGLKEGLSCTKHGDGQMTRAKKAGCKCSCGLGKKLRGEKNSGGYSLKAVVSSLSNRLRDLPIIVSTIRISFIPTSVLFRPNVCYETETNTMSMSSKTFRAMFANRYMFCRCIDLALLLDRELNTTSN